MYISVLCLTLLATFLRYTGAADILLVSICQKNAVSREKCSNIVDDTGQNTNLKILNFYEEGDWTIFPTVTRLLKELEDEKWILFATEHTKIKIEALVSTLANYDENNEVFIGHAMEDPEPIIIHHFAPNLFTYPLLPAGFLLSRVLLQRLSATMATETNYLSSDFSIDGSYEFANYLWDYLKINLVNENAFCIEPAAGCATYVDVNPKQVGVTDVSEVAFAVKTCEKFHNDRIPAVQSTWGSKCKNIAFYSDVRDNSIPTVRLDVTHTDHGHCEKSRAIIRTLKGQFQADSKLKWAVIVDDDTILRILRLVSEYNSSEAMVIGERYGYKLLSNGGYNYATGGGGVILSRAALRHFKKKSCTCPSASTPDDMFLFGICLKKLGIDLVHTPLMHQARPNDYSNDLLRIAPAVSFHKHWMINPVEVYRQWFHNFDNPTHQEL